MELNEAGCKRQLRYVCLTGPPQNRADNRTLQGTLLLTAGLKPLQVLILAFILQPTVDVQSNSVRMSWA